MQTGPAPTVSIVMAVHNGETYLRQAIDSMLGQSIADFEFLIVDDASTDGTATLLAEAAARDPRIRVVTLAENLGLAGALNAGLEQARGEFVARMDADDVSHPDRLAQQLAALTADPGLLLVGASVAYIDPAGQVTRTTRRARDPWAIRWMLRFQPAVPHPTFLFRRCLPDGTPVRYDPACRLAQDYELVCRLVEHGEAACLGDVLLDYRVHEGAVSVARIAEQRAQAARIATAYQARVLPGPLFAALEPVRSLMFGPGAAEPARIRAAVAGLKAMLAHDIAEAPERRVWLERQTAQLAIWMLQRAGASRGTILRTLAGPARRFAWPALLRLLEVKGVIPAPR